MKNIIKFLLFLGVISLSACMKDDTPYIDPNIAINEQYIKDSILMSKFIVDKAIDTSGVKFGVLYQILEPGDGEQVNDNSFIKVKYQGRLLDGTIFDETKDEAVPFRLGGLIPGWRIGIPLIREGGKIRLIIPSYYGYGSTPRNGIPANSVLDFDIELLKEE